MSATVLTRTLADQRRSLLVWAGSAMALVAMYVAVWPSLEGQPSMSDFLDQMPEAMRSLFAASGADMSTPVGYVQIELLSFMGPLLVIGYAVSAGVGAVAGEEERHTLDLLLTTPVGRPGVVLERFAAMVLGTLGIAAVLGASLILEGRLTGLDLPVGDTARRCCTSALLGVVFGSLALALSASTGHAALSRGVAGAGRRGRLRRQRPGPAGVLAGAAAEGLAVLPVHRARPAAHRRLRAVGARRGASPRWCCSGSRSPASAAAT